MPPIIEGLNILSPLRKVHILNKSANQQIHHYCRDNFQGCLFGWVADHFMFLRIYQNFILRFGNNWSDYIFINRRNKPQWHRWQETNGVLVAEFAVLSRSDNELFVFTKESIKVVSSLFEVLTLVRVLSA